MKVVVVQAEFKQDDSHYRALSSVVDLTVYGHREKLRGQTVEAQAPPAVGRIRVLKPVVLTPCGPLVWFYPGLRRALSEDRPEVVHVIGEPWRPIVVQAAAWARKHLNAALVVHGSDRNWWAVPAAEQATRKVFARRTFARADGYAGESQAAVAEAERFGIGPGAVTAVIHTNPRDPTVFRPAADEQERRAVRRAFGLPIDGVGIGFLGRLTEEKGPLLFLDAADRLGAPDGTWTAIAGMGPLEAVVRSRVTPPRMTFVGRLEYPGRVADFYRAVDVLVVPSLQVGRWEEQGPRAIIEAMLSGCAVVATRVGGMPEMLGETGVVVEPEPAALADGIARAIGYEASAARQRAVDLYSGEAVGRALVALWKGALARRERLACAGF